MPSKRQQLTEEELNQASYGIWNKTLFRFEQKGHGSFSSSHEILGILNEEMKEYTDAVHENQSDHDKIEELKDIAVAALFGIASIRSGGVDW